MPYITVDQIGDDPEYELSGESGQSRLSVQVDCYAEDYVRAAELGGLVRNRLSGYRGLLDDTTWCSKVTMVRSNTFSEGAEDGGDNYVFRASMDFEIVYGRSVPDFT